MAMRVVLLFSLCLALVVFTLPAAVLAAPEQPVPPAGVPGGDAAPGKAVETPAGGAENGAGNGVKNRDFGMVRPVPPEVAAGKITGMLNRLYASLASVVIPLSMVVLLISALFLIPGSFLGAEMVRRMGWGGIIAGAAGLLVFWGIPLIIGITKSIADALTSG